VVRAASGRFRVVLATDLTRIGVVVETVASCALSTPSASRQTIFRLRTILAEAIANAMVYGNQGEASRLVTIEVELYDDRLVIAVTDEGVGFDPAAIAPPTIDDRLGATRGRGLFLIRRLADHVAFNDRGNTIWMTLPRS
jgi:anti-sigma regulatory factor (Ser/Thr protein kinase)